MSWWRKSRVEQPLSVRPSDHVTRRIASLERAFASELTGSASLNIRGAFLAGGAAVALLLVAQFSATWLDDEHWEFPDVWDIVMQTVLVGTAIAFGLSVLLSVWAVGVAVASRQRFASASRR